MGAGSFLVCVFTAGALSEHMRQQLGGTSTVFLRMAASVLGASLGRLGGRRQSKISKSLSNYLIDIDGTILRNSDGAINENAFAIKGTVLDALGLASIT